VTENLAEVGNDVTVKVINKQRVKPNRAFSYSGFIGASPLRKWLLGLLPCVFDSAASWLPSDRARLAGRDSTSPLLWVPSMMSVGRTEQLKICIWPRGGCIEGRAQS
jgi:hypothetical protein